MQSQRSSLPLAVHSFDLFDTLLGRFHYNHEYIFELIEKQFPFPGFAFYRKAAEYKSNKTLSDIYRHFQQLTEITEKQAESLMECEFQLELLQIFPITENLNLVQEGDLIVTDTSYNTAQIQQILHRIGLHKPVHIYASTQGKASGIGWHYIRHHHTILSHLGDSMHSDVLMPQSFNIPAHHDTKSSWSTHEQALRQLGQEELACLIRATRLHNPYPPSSPEYMLWNEQCQINLPLLVHSCLYLDAFCKKSNIQRVLFTSRDCCLWIRLFKIMFPTYESIYFHTSRFIYKLPTPSFIEYVRNLYTDATIIVDSHGRGRSCVRFFHRHLHQHPTYLAIFNSGKACRGILRIEKPCEAVEKFNYDLVGSLFDIQQGAPLRAPLEYEARFIRPFHACIDQCISLLPQFSLHTFDLRVIQWAYQAITTQGLFIDQCIRHAVTHWHIPQNDGSRRHIHQLEYGELFEKSEGSVSGTAQE